MSKRTLDRVMRHLEQERDAAVERLCTHREASALEWKLELDLALSCLAMFEKLGIDPTFEAFVLPEKRTTTPSSEYRLVEDHETDDPRYWKEVDLDGHALRPHPGAILLVRKGS